MRLSRTEAVVNYAVLSLFSLWAAFPLIGVLLTSLTPSEEAKGGFTWPSRIAVENFGQAWRQGKFGSYLTSSVIVSVSVVILTVILSTLAGYAFARMQFPLSTPLFYILLVGLMLPAEAFIIPLYYDLKGAGLTDTYWALIFPQVAQSLAFGTFWMRNQFRQFPTSIIEAARLDGASEFRLLWQVAAPASRPAIVTMCLLVGMWTWNEFLLPLVMVTSETLRTAPLGMAFFQGQHSTEFAFLAAAGVIIALPIVVLYIGLQKYFISGMIGGSRE